MPGDRDSGLSTEGSQQSEPPEEELMTISVSQEVKRFQQEINKVAIENTRFHHWKKTRAPVGKLQKSQHTVVRRSASFESLVETQVANPNSKTSEEEAPPCLPPRSRFTSQDSLLAQAPALPPRSKTSKRVSYAPQEATVLGSPPESNLDLYNKSLERRQRQIFPGTHMAPSEPPTEDEMEPEKKEERDLIGASRDEESGEPVLPSVRQLASRFQVIFLFLH